MTWSSGHLGRRILDYILRIASKETRGTPGLKMFDRDCNVLGNASLFTKCLFTILVLLEPPLPKQRSDGFPLISVLLRESKLGFPTFSGKGPDCVADPFGTVPRCCY